MVSLLLASVCGVFANGMSAGYGGAWEKQWLAVSLFIVLAVLSISGLLYAISGVMPTKRREKLKGIIHYEMFEAFVSIILIFSVLLLSGLACYAGSVLFQSSSYQGLFYNDEVYIGDLLFNRGTALVSQLYTSAIEYGIASQALSYVIGNALTYIHNAFVTAHPNFVIFTGPSIDISSILNTYASQFLGTYASIVLIVWGVLFIIFLSLPLIQASALTVVLPVAIITRLFAYSGPKLREVSNTFIAFAIGLFFVFPLTIALDSQITTCLITPTASNCGWLYSQYIQPVPEQVPVSSLFTSSTAPISGFQVSLNVFSAIATSGAAPGLSMVTLLFNAPVVAWDYATKIADYVFMGIVLIGIDFLITIGFIAGFAKGLSSISGLFEGGEFW
ncbi:MAG: hypothetical protein ACP5IK_00920 [Candidatus Micrarchaeia archaeon]